MLVQALLVMLVLIAVAVPVAATLGWLGLWMSAANSALPLHNALGDIAWQNTTDFLLVAIPMFILMGELLLRSGISERMYNGMAHWLGWLPGGLMHSNIGACTLFAATSGSSVATAATVGIVALPEIEKRRYNERLFLGTIAAGGTLGILIPPSINLIVYGMLTDTSVSELYLAGFVPGLVLAGLFSATIIVACLLHPGWGGTPMKTSWLAKIRSLPGMLPPFGLFVVVVGSIYAGIATPTEAAALGVVAAMGLAAWNRTLSIAMLKVAVENTMRTTSMIMLIVLAAIFLNFVLGALGVTQALANFVFSFGLSAMQTMFLIILFYLILGCFMETFSMLLTTAPLITPIVIKLGFDPVWFGILLMVLLEAALITPPVGLNLYVVQGIRKRGSINDVIVGVLPFVVAMFVMLGLLVAFPRIALWLPKLVY